MARTSRKYSRPVPQTNLVRDPIAQAEASVDYSPAYPSAEYQALVNMFEDEMLTTYGSFPPPVWQVRKVG